MAQIVAIPLGGLVRSRVVLLVWSMMTYLGKYKGGHRSRDCRLGLLVKVTISISSHNSKNSEFKSCCYYCCVFGASKLVSGG
jgi:hypothetical protein